MKVLVIGGGGREHALIWALSRSPRVTELYCAPGNAGTAELAENVDLSVDDTEGLLSFARETGIDLTVVGPEAPLMNGLSDRFRQSGLAVFGPSARAAAIEGSKDLAKDIMNRHGIPTAACRTFTDAHKACEFVRRENRAFVVKADGLAAGKGVVVAETVEETCGAIRSMLEGHTMGDAGARVLVEEILEGPEISVLAFTDGHSVIPMVWSQDHKRVFDGDKGPNTGGMGAYSPPKYHTPELADEIGRTILQPIVRALKEEDRMYQGVLYAGLMLTHEGPKVLEFNARFGDPEAQVVLMRLETDLVDIMEAVLEERLSSCPVHWDRRATAGVVLASGGYPGSYQTGIPIEGLELNLPDTLVFHAGTRLEEGRVVTAGGRVLTVCAWGDTLEEAVSRAYRRADAISFSGMHRRGDIGWRSLYPDSSGEA